MKVIVALKRVADPDNANKVAIFQIADYGLVADLFQAVPLLVDELRRRRS